MATENYTIATPNGGAPSGSAAGQNSAQPNLSALGSAAGWQSAVGEQQRPEGAQGSLTAQESALELGPSISQVGFKSSASNQDRRSEAAGSKVSSSDFRSLVELQKQSIEAIQVEINGHVEGKITADVVVIGKSAVIKGDIFFKKTK